MTQKRSWSFDSIIISVMLSESKVFRCHELPDWQRWVWLIWAMLPGAVANIIGIFAILSAELLADWRSGWQFIFGAIIPVGVATG